MSRAERLPHLIRRAYFGRDYDRFLALKTAGRIVFGTHSYGAPRVYAFDHDDTRLVVGAYTSIANTASFVLGGNHPLDRLSTFPFRIRLGLEGAGQDGYPWSKGDISVGSDVWIGHGATILSGAEIGDGAVVTAGTLVTGAVPDYAIVGGHPAKTLRFRCSEAERETLTRISWWNWPPDEVAAAAEVLSQSDLTALVAFAHARAGADSAPSAGAALSVRPAARPV